MYFPQPINSLQQKVRELYGYGHTKKAGYRAHFHPMGNAAGAVGYCLLGK